jgi:hypothetical protein
LSLGRCSSAWIRHPNAVWHYGRQLEYRRRTHALNEIGQNIGSKSSWQKIMAIKIGWQNVKIINSGRLENAEIHTKVLLCFVVESLLSRE